jgi:hypothetical protein
MTRHRHLGQAFGGHDPGVCAHVVRANAVQQSGDRKGAKDSVANGLALAETLDHPNTLAHALHNGGIGFQLVGDRDAAFAAADRAAGLAKKFGLLRWRAMSRESAFICRKSIACAANVFWRSAATTRTRRGRLSRVPAKSQIGKEQ